MNLPSTVDAGPVLVDPVLWAALALGVGSARGFVSQGAADLERRGELESLDVSAADPIAARPTESPQERFNLEPPVVLRKGSSPDPFFISWCSQREVALTLEWQVFLCIWCGPILTLAGLWVLSVSFARH
jgi:hypothetical protein